MCAFARLVRNGNVDYRTSTSSKLYLKQVKNLSATACLLELLSKHGHMLCERMLQDLSLSLPSKCIIPASLATYSARNSLGYRICCETCTLLSNLLIHVAVLEKSRWDRAKEEFDFHVNELIFIQDRVQGKVQRIYGGYSYIRDLSNNIWNHPRLREKYYHTTKASIGNKCAHCGCSSLIHPKDNIYIWNESMSKVKDKRVENVKSSGS